MGDWARKGKKGGSEKETSKEKGETDIRYHCSFIAPILEHLERI